jgi:hypothetical protein
MASASPDVQEREIRDSGPPGPQDSMQFAAPSEGAAAPSDSDDDNFLLTPDDVLLLDSVKPTMGGAAGAESALVCAPDKRSSSAIWQDDLELEIKMELEGTVEKGLPPIRRDGTTKVKLLGSFTDFAVDDGLDLFWVKRRFHKLSVDGSLPRSSFGACIGNNSILPVSDRSVRSLFIYCHLIRSINSLLSWCTLRMGRSTVSGMKDEEFAGKLFDYLARLRNISRDTITITELSEFWKKIPEGCLQIFFDM